MSSRSKKRWLSFYLLKNDANIFVEYRRTGYCQKCSLRQTSKPSRYLGGFESTSNEFLKISKNQSPDDSPLPVGADAVVLDKSSLPKGLLTLCERDLTPKFVRDATTKAATICTLSMRDRCVEIV